MAQGPNRIRRRLQVLVPLGAGAATTLAFAPFGLAPLAVLGPALLFYLWLGASPGRAFRHGWLFGLGLLGTGVSWVHVSIEQFGHVPPLLAAFITLLFVVGMALYFGLAGWLSLKLAPSRAGCTLLLVYPAVWVSVEWLRGWFLTGFPWLALGYSQLDWPLAGLAPLLGVYGVGWAVAVSAGGLALLVVGRGSLRYYVLGGLALLWVASAGLAIKQWTAPAGEPLRVSLVQGNIPQEVKWHPDQLRPSLRLYWELTREHWDSDLIVWPETAVPAFEDRVEQGLLAPLEEEARAGDSDLLLGIPVRDRETGRYFNAMITLGEFRDRYFKRHLVPFGEFLPLQPLLGPLVVDLLEIPMSDFSTGDDLRPLVRVAGYQAGVSICYEDAFGEEVIQALPEAAFLVNASNDAWFGDSLAPHQHLQIARMRALESGRYLLRSTNTGISAIIGSGGELLGTSPAFTQDVLSGSIRPLQGLTPYARVGNSLVVSVVLLLLGISAIWRLRAGEGAGGEPTDTRSLRRSHNVESERSPETAPSTGC